MKAKNWINRIRREFSGEQYQKWLMASYAQKRLNTVSLMTGDLLLLKTWGPYASDGADSHWSQVSMVVQNPSSKLREVYELSDEHQTFVLEADISAIKREEVKLVPLEELISAYRDLYGRDFLYVYRKLELPDRKDDAVTFPELENWLLAIKGRFYSRSKEELLNSIIRKTAEASERGLFSAQLISATYKEMGLIRPEELYQLLQRRLPSLLRHGWEMSPLRLLRGAALDLANRLVPTS